MGAVLSKRRHATTTPGAMQQRLPEQLGQLLVAGGTETPPANKPLPLSRVFIQKSINAQTLTNAP